MDYNNATRSLKNFFPLKPDFCAMGSLAVRSHLRLAVRNLASGVKRNLIFVGIIHPETSSELQDFYLNRISFFISSSEERTRLRVECERRRNSAYEDPERRLEKFLFLLISVELIAFREPLERCRDFWLSTIANLECFRGIHFWCFEARPLIT